MTRTLGFKTSFDSSPNSCTCTAVIVENSLGRTAAKVTLLVKKNITMLFYPSLFYQFFPSLFLNIDKWNILVILDGRYNIKQSTMRKVRSSVIHRIQNSMKKFNKVLLDDYLLPRIYYVQRTVNQQNKQEGLAGRRSQAAAAGTQEESHYLLDY